MKMSELNGEEEVIWRIVMLRGLGFSLEEVSGKTGLSYGRIRYRTRMLKELAEKESEEKVFFQVTKLFLSYKSLKDVLTEEPKT